MAQRRRRSFLVTLGRWNGSRERVAHKPKDGPVFITDRGRPAHVLLSFAEYQRLTGQRRNIADALALPGVEDVEFDPPRADIRIKETDFR
ncbi:type II toxin-antitoxin system prevent-host-death family antitoxin [Burkholderia sp. 22313]|uniref:type II toxin-antitoxin system prevent-host-death family antitoxin n=1 Tax=Burkholderia sp. 22313 TaxID=3453908 RepID=UPI003F879FEE